MKRKIAFKFLFSTGILLTILSSCKEIDLTNISDEVTFDESLIVPIGQGSASIGDVLAQFVDKDNLVIEGDTVNYITDYSYDYIFKPIDIIQYAVPRNIAINGFAPATIPVNSTVPISGSNSFTVDLGLDPNSTTKRVDSTYVSSTAIGITITVSGVTLASNGAPISPSDLKVILGFPKMLNGGNRTPVGVAIPYSFGVPYNLALGNVIVDTHGQNGIPVDVSLSSGTRAIKVDASSSININVRFNSVNFSVCYGLFQPTTIQSTSIKIPLDVLKTLPTGLQFANPKALINVESNVGSWLDFNIDYVKAYNKNKTVVKNASFNGSPSTSETIKRKPTAPGQFMNWDLKTLDRNYGTTNQLFETNDVLDTLEYKFSLTASQATPPPSFVVQGMAMKAKVRIKIPMHFEKGSVYDYTDTIEYDNSKVDYVDKGILVLKITNGLPAGAKFGVKLLDANMHLISSTLSDKIYEIKSATVGANGLTTASIITDLNIELTSAQVKDIKAAKYFVYNIRLEGQDPLKELQFTTKNIFGVKVGVFAKINKTTNL